MTSLCSSDSLEVRSQKLLHLEFIIRLVKKELQFWTMNFKSLHLGSNTSLLIKIGTIIINTFLPMSDKFVYPCSIKIYASGFDKLFPRVLLPRCCWDAWRSGRQLMTGQVNMVDVTKVLSPVHSSFAALVVHCAVRHCCGEELDPFCWPVLAAGFAVFVHLINLLSILLRCTGFTGIQKAIVDQMGSRPPDSDHDLLLVQVWLWEVLWSFISV